MQNNIRRINTNMYGDIAYKFLCSLRPADCDYGAWQRYEKGCLGNYAQFFHMHRDSNNRIYITVNDPQIPLENRDKWLKWNEIKTYVFDKTDAQILSWLAAKIKKYINRQVQYYDWYYERDDKATNIPKLKTSNKWWNDTNGYVISSLYINHGGKKDASIADIYNICRSLKGKKKIKNGDRVLGKPLTDDEVLNAKYIAEMKDKYIREYRIQHCKLFETYRQKLKDEYDNLKKEFTDKLHEIDPMCNANDVLGVCHNML